MDFRQVADMIPPLFSPKQLRAINRRRKQAEKQADADANVFMQLVIDAMSWNPGNNGFRQDRLDAAKQRFLAAAERQTARNSLRSMLVLALYRLGLMLIIIYFLDKYLFGVL